MRAFDVALFMMLFSLFLSFSVEERLYSTSTFGSEQGPNVIDPEYMENINISEQAPSGFDPFGGTAVTNFVFGTINALGFATAVLWGASIGLQNTIWQTLGGSAEAWQIAIVLAIPIWLIYILGIAQFLRGTGLRGMR